MTYAGNHLHIEEVTNDGDLDSVFKALADPTRRGILDALRLENGQSLRELCEGASMARQSLTQHLDLLVEANLVVVTRRGRERRHYLNPHPIHEMHQRWTREFEHKHFDVIDAVKHNAEESAMNTDNDFPDYVYVTYIHATAQQVWDALTDHEITACTGTMSPSSPTGKSAPRGRTTRAGPMVTLTRGGRSSKQTRRTNSSSPSNQPSRALTKKGRSPHISSRSPVRS